MELRELMEVAGLLNDKEIAVLEKAEQENAEVLQKYADELREKYVGEFVKTAKYAGLINNVHICGYAVYLGLVTSRGDEWTATLVKPEDVDILKDAASIRVAKEAARRYFLLELESLEFNNKAKSQHIAERINTIKEWLKILK